MLGVDRSSDWVAMALSARGHSRRLVGGRNPLMLPDRPNEAQWLRSNERDWINARLAEERATKADSEQMTIWQALRHPPVLILYGWTILHLHRRLYFLVFRANHAPTVDRLERSAGQLDGPGHLGAGLLGMLLLGASSDRTSERRWHFAIPQLTAAIALILLLFLPRCDLLSFLSFFSLLSDSEPLLICRLSGRCPRHF